MHTKCISKTRMGFSHLTYTVLFLVMAGCSKHPQESTAALQNVDKQIIKEQDAKDERKGHGGSENGEISGESSVEESNSGKGNGGGNNDERNEEGDEGEGDRRSNDNEDNRASDNEESDSEEPSIENQMPPAQYLDKTSTVSVTSPTGSSNDEVLDRGEEPKDEINNRYSTLARQLSIEQEEPTLATTADEVQKETDTDTPTIIANRPQKVQESDIDKELNVDSKVGPPQETLKSNQKDIARKRRKKLAPLKVDERLASTHMRGFIESQFMTCLEGFKESEDAFSSGGVMKHTFFFREDDVSGDRTYIALANDYPEDDQNTKYVKSGEQSISRVLNEIKNDLDRAQNNSVNTQILIPLQQIDKEHWILLEIVLKPGNGPESNTGGTTTAQCYDPKTWISGSNLVDWWINPQRMNYVNDCVKEQFSVDTVWMRQGVQAIGDNHNCGRYTLIEMGSLLRLENAPQSLKEINEILAPESGKQQREQLEREDHTKIQEESHLVASSSEDWEELGN